MSDHKVERQQKREARRKRAEHRQRLADEALLDQMRDHLDSDQRQQIAERLAAESYYLAMEAAWAG
jgi:hypothetical protein